MELTVVIPFWNGHRHITPLLDSIPKHIPVLIVDDHSDEPLQINRTNVTVVRPDDKGYFTGAVNFGLRACTTDVLVLNQDSTISPTALNMLADKSQHYGLIGERISGQHPAFEHGYIHGTFMFIRQDVLQKVGLMDAKHFPLWGSTADYQLRTCRKGFSALPLKRVPGFHHKRGNKRFGSSIRELLRRFPETRNRMIRTPPTISVVINAYNHGRYLNDAVNCLIGGETSLGHMDGQTFQGFEIVIVDDGSTDNTPDILRDLVNPWKGVHALRQRNSGSAAACNTGIKYAKGKFIATMDSDDMMREERLERMLAVCESSTHSVVCDDMSLFKDGELIKDPRGKSRWWMPEYDFEKLIHKNIMHKGLMFPKKAWREAGGYPEIMNRGREDWAFNIALGIKGWCGVRVEFPGYLYRREGQNRTLENTNPAHMDSFRQQLYSLFPRIYSGERPDMCCGKSSGVRKQAPRRMSMNTVPGEKGMVLVEYIGTNAGDQTWWGPTGRRYELGGIKKRGYVDRRDLDHFLTNFYDGAKPAFRVASKQTAKKSVKTVKPASPAASPTVYEPLTVAEATVEKVAVPPPSEYTVKQLGELVVSMTQGELDELLTQEQAGKNRVSAARLIEAQIEQLG